MPGKEVVAAHAHSSAVFSGALGIFDQFIAQNAHRIVIFGLFDRSVLRVLKMRLHRVHAIGALAGPITSRDRLVVSEVFSRLRMAPAKGQIADDALSAGHDTLGQRRGQRLEH